MENHAENTFEHETPIQPGSTENTQQSSPSAIANSCDEQQKLLERLELQNVKLAHAANRYWTVDYLLALWENLLPSRRLPFSKPTGFPSNAGLQSGCDVVSKHLFHPVANLLCDSLYVTTKSAQDRVRQSCDDLYAWKFDPESLNGKQLMARTRRLLNENHSLGRANHGEQFNTLENEAEVQTKCINEFEKTHEEIQSVSEEALVDLDSFQTSLLVLQQKISEAESVIRILQNEIEYHRPGRVRDLLNYDWTNPNETDMQQKPVAK